MFADDTGIMVASQSVSDFQNLVNDDVQSLVNWVQFNKLSLNILKTTHFYRIKKEGGSGLHHPHPPTPFIWELMT